MRINYWFFISAILAFVIVLLLSIKSCNTNRSSKPSAVLTKTEIRYKTDTVFQQIMRITKGTTSIVHDSIFTDRLLLSPPDTIYRYLISCSDLVFITDTFAKKNSFIAIVDDTLQHNRIIGRSFRFADLRPDTIRSYTQRLPAKTPLVKLYVGFDLGLGYLASSPASYQGGVDVDAIFSDRFLLGIKGGLNSRLETQLGLRFSSKISFKKP